MILLEVEALRHRGRRARRLLEEEVHDPELREVLVGLVEADAVRIRAWVRDLGAEPCVLNRAVERVSAVPRRRRSERAGALRGAARDQQGEDENQPPHDDPPWFLAPVYGGVQATAPVAHTTFAKKPQDARKVCHNLSPTDLDFSHQEPNATRPIYDQIPGGDPGRPAAGRRAPQPANYA